MTTYVGDLHDTYPYSAVVHVRATFGNGEMFTGSGTMVGPNDVLTASHLIYDAYLGLATEIVVTPGLDGYDEPFGTYDFSTVNYFPVDQDGDGLLTTRDSEQDFAVIGLGSRVGDVTGYMGLDPTATSGWYTLTGYPGVYEINDVPRMTSDYGYAREDMFSYTYDLDQIEINPGNSGGPLWYENEQGPYVVAVASTSGWAADVAAHYDTLLSWIAGNDDGLPIDQPVLVGDDPQVVGPIDQTGVDVGWYYAMNGDVAAAGVNAASHYMVHGWREGRDPNSWFDSDGYLAVYQDVAAVGVNPLTHYVTFGWREGRDPSALFDTSTYLDMYRDVALAGINPLDHFLNNGYAEGRMAFESDADAWMTFA